jgi:hypothetical protein
MRCQECQIYVITVDPLSDLTSIEGDVAERSDPTCSSRGMAPFQQTIPNPLLSRTNLDNGRPSGIDAGSEPGSVAPGSRPSKARTRDSGWGVMIGTLGEPTGDLSVEGHGLGRCLALMACLSTVCWRLSLLRVLARGVPDDLPEVSVGVAE